MAAKQSQSSSSTSQKSGDDVAQESDTAPIEVPAEVREALGGIPIPPPPVRAPRPTVTRVGDPLATTRPDPRGILADPRPERRDAVKRIDAARSQLARLVTGLSADLAGARKAVESAAQDNDACEAEGYHPQAALNMLGELESVLEKHLG